MILVSWAHDLNQALSIDPILDEARLSHSKKSKSQKKSKLEGPCITEFPWKQGHFGFLLLGLFLLFTQ